MDLLHYVFFYLVAALLLFQGVQALGELREPSTTVPDEVRPACPARTRRFGALLVAVGALAALCGLASHFWTGLQPYLVPATWRLLGLMGLYGLYVVFFSRRVVYMGTPSVETHHH